MGSYYDYYCGASGSALPPSAPPPGVPPDSATAGLDGWIAFGVVLAEVAIMMLTLGTNIQRFGLTVTAREGGGPPRSPVIRLGRRVAESSTEHKDSDAVRPARTP